MVKVDSKGLFKEIKAEELTSNALRCLIRLTLQLPRKIVRLIQW